MESKKVLSVDNPWLFVLMMSFVADFHYPKRTIPHNLATVKVAGIKDFVKIFRPAELPGPGLS